MTTWLIEVVHSGGRKVVATPLEDGYRDESRAKTFISYDRAREWLTENGYVEDGAEDSEEGDQAD